MLFLQAVRQGGEIDKVGGGPQLLGDEADILVGLVIAGGDAGIAHQGADVGDGTAQLGMCLQPGDQLSDQMAPADPQMPGAELPQKLYRTLREQLVGGVVVFAVLHQNAVPDGGGQPQLFQQ